MSWKFKECSDSVQSDTSAADNYFDIMQKPIEVFVFIDPLCPESWSLEPILKKLTAEFGRFFTIQPILTGCLKKLNKDHIKNPTELKDAWDRTAKLTGMCCDGDIWVENPLSTPSMISLAIKAAELQGKRAGRIFLRRIQEAMFLKKENVAHEQVLKKYAKKANLDVEEFSSDLYSTSAKKALQCDHKLTREMQVDSVPTIVLFNQLTHSDGIKISGLHDYDTYVQVFKEVLQKKPLPSQKPTLEELFATYQIIGTKEIAVVYDWTEEKAEKELKKLQLKRMLRKIPVKYGCFWEYQGNA